MWLILKSKFIFTEYGPCMEEKYTVHKHKPSNHKLNIGDELIEVKIVRRFEMKDTSKTLVEIK